MTDPQAKPDLGAMRKLLHELLDEYAARPHPERLETLIRNMGYYTDAWVNEAAERMDK